MNIEIWETLLWNTKNLKLHFIWIIIIGLQIENYKIREILIATMTIVVLVNDCWFQVPF